jgi:hypothetical protein
MVVRAKRQLLVGLLWLCAMGSTPAQAHFLDWFLGPPGTGVHIFPDWRKPLNPPPTPPPPPTYPNFNSQLQSYIQFCEDIAGLKNWYSALTAAEQEHHKPDYLAALARLGEAEDRLVQMVLTPLAAGDDEWVYRLFDAMRRIDPIRARGLFVAVLDKVGARINMEYLQDPHNAIKARRARDVVAIRSWVGRN